MTDDREPFREARAAWKAKHHEQRLENATYTAAEVKVLTEAALRLGRKEALEEAAAKLQGYAADPHDVHGDAANGAFLMAAGIVRGMARQPLLSASEPRTDPGMDSDLPQDSQAGRDACTCPPHIDGIGREKWPDCPVHTLREDA